MKVTTVIKIAKVAVAAAALGLATADTIHTVKNTKNPHEIALDAVRILTTITGASLLIVDVCKS